MTKLLTDFYDIVLGWVLSMWALTQYLRGTLMEPVIFWVADCLAVHYKGINVICF